MNNVPIQDPCPAQVTIPTVRSGSRLPISTVLFGAGLPTPPAAGPKVSRSGRSESGRVGPGGETSGRPGGGVGRPARTDGPKNRDVTGRLIRRPACPISFAFHRRRTDSPTALPSSTRILANRRPDRSIIPVCDGGAGHHPDRRTDHGTTRRGHRGARLIRRTGPRADVRAPERGPTLLALLTLLALPLGAPRCPALSFAVASLLSSGCSAGRSAGFSPGAA